MGRVLAASDLKQNEKDEVPWPVIFKFSHPFRSGVCFAPLD